MAVPPTGARNGPAGSPASAKRIRRSCLSSALCLAGIAKPHERTKFRRGWCMSVSLFTYAQHTCTSVICECMQNFTLLAPICHPRCSNGLRIYACGFRYQQLLQKQRADDKAKKDKKREKTRVRDVSASRGLNSDITFARAWSICVCERHNARMQSRKRQRVKIKGKAKKNKLKNKEHVKTERERKKVLTRE